jgi:hypothetical protein
MENTQMILNDLIIALLLTFAVLITIDFFAGLMVLWKQPCNYDSKAAQLLPLNPDTESTNTLVSLKVAQENFRQAVNIASDTANNIDTESLALLIQLLSQARIRTTARRLGIADKVDGKYHSFGGFENTNPTDVKVPTTGSRADTVSSQFLKHHS